jgi:hypothetical protein
MKDFDISKIFWSKCRTKILEKLYLEFESWNNDWLHMRALSRGLDEQINSIKRELDNLSEIWLLKSREELKKKIFCINTNFLLHNDFLNIFIKTYNPLNKVKSYFKQKNDLELIIVNEAIKNKLTTNWKNILDIFLIWEIDKEDLSEFLSLTFYWRKIKYAIITTEDFFKRLEFWDKLIKNILTESWNIYLKDNLKVKEKLGI